MSSSPPRQGSSSSSLARASAVPHASLAGLPSALQDLSLASSPAEREAELCRDQASSSPDNGGSSSDGSSSSSSSGTPLPLVLDAVDVGPSAGPSFAPARLQRKRTNPLAFVRRPPQPHEAPIPVRLRSSHMIHDPASPFHRRSVAPSSSSSSSSSASPGSGNQALSGSRSGGHSSSSSSSHTTRPGPRRASSFVPGAAHPADHTAQPTLTVEGRRASVPTLPRR